jgi:hypothetical protein
MAASISAVGRMVSLMAEADFAIVHLVIIGERLPGDPSSIFRNPYGYFLEPVGGAFVYPIRDNKLSKCSGHSSAPLVKPTLPKALTPPRYPH